MRSGLLDQPVSSLTVREMGHLIESRVKELLQEYGFGPRDYFIDDGGSLCFTSEEAYANYLSKQDKPPSEVNAYYIENGVKIVYSDHEPSPELVAQLEEVHQQIEAGAPLTEHGDLHQRLGV